VRKPDWADPKTIEWCAGVCDAIAARSVLEDRRRGAEACASILRLMIDSYKPPEP
jgi:hypothetical protein